jgi:hypothetical protein
MATLEEKISALEAEIVGYEAKLDAATTEAGQKMYADLIIAIRKDITAIRQQQLQLQGKLIIPLTPVNSTFTAALKLFLFLGSPLISPSRSRLSVI